jgi:phosphoribosyl 1,2-cyclic phosphodiesterase
MTADAGTATVHRVDQTRTRLHRLADGTELILDAGTGIRELGATRAPESETMEVLLTHLHVDHIHGLLFFPPLFDAQSRITVYGPASPGPSLERPLGRYLSAPLSPLDLRELPARVKFVACPYLQWRIGDATIAAAIVAHRGVTLGYRITEGDTSLCYLPDHGVTPASPTPSRSPCAPRSNN